MSINLLLFPDCSFPIFPSHDWFCSLLIVKFLVHILPLSWYLKTDNTVSICEYSKGFGEWDRMEWGVCHWWVGRMEWNLSLAPSDMFLTSGHFFLCCHKPGVSSRFSRFSLACYVQINPWPLTATVWSTGAGNLGLTTIPYIQHLS